ncbi:SphA family protein [Gluconacetobacter azotocaptans]|uniref:SphA family protein n=1 Tax=Gluconacetobacter azotocaptans TaxID=142834 RepID=UPI0019595C8F|nr:transporter [Gluconacetobacter azotocaptans]
MLVGAMSSVAPPSAMATEGGAGHYIVGAYVTPVAGVLPPQPGLYWSDVNLYYDAGARKSQEIPVAGNVVTGLHAAFSSFALSAIYVSNLHVGPVAFAAGITWPGQYLDARGSIGRLSRSDTSGGLRDMIITPVILGWHSGGHFLRGRIDIFAPTGPYNRGSLANIGMNYRTFTPTVSYSWTQPKIGLDISENVGIDVNTTNDKTKYRSGALFHLDTAATKTIGTAGPGLGLAGSLLYQITDDTGALAIHLGGFQGRSFAVGPVGRYTFKVGGMAINSSLRWLPEFAVRKRPSGNAVYLSFTGRF